MDIEQIIEAIVRRVVREEIAEAFKARSDLIPIAEYAAARGINPATVRMAIKDGRLGVVRNGRAWRVRANEEIAARKRNEDEAAHVRRLIKVPKRRSP